MLAPSMCEIGKFFYNNVFRSYAKFGGRFVREHEYIFEKQHQTLSFNRRVDIWRGSWKEMQAKENIFMTIRGDILTSRCFQRAPV